MQKLFLKPWNHLYILCLKVPYILCTCICIFINCNEPTMIVQQMHHWFLWDTLTVYENDINYDRFRFVKYGDEVCFEYNYEKKLKGLGSIGLVAIAKAARFLHIFQFPCAFFYIWSSYNSVLWTGNLSLVTFFSHAWMINYWTNIIIALSIYECPKEIN